MTRIKIVKSAQFKAKIARFKAGKVAAVLHASLADTWRAGAAEFVNEVLKHIQRETAMSGATLFPLARVIKKGSIEQVQKFIAGRSKVSAQDRAEFPKGKRQKPPRERSAAAGERAGKRAFTFDVGGPASPVFTFIFRTVVFHFRVNEADRQDLIEGQTAFLNLVIRRLNTDVQAVMAEYFRTGTVDATIVIGR